MRNVCRTITAAAVTISALGYTGLLNLTNYIYIEKYVFTLRMLPQVWRVLTAFFITAPKFGILMDPYFCTPSA